MPTLTLAYGELTVRPFSHCPLFHFPWLLLFLYDYRCCFCCLVFIRAIAISFPSINILSIYSDPWVTARYFRHCFLLSISSGVFSSIIIVVVWSSLALLFFSFSSIILLVICSGPDFFGKFLCCGLIFCTLN